MTNKVLLMLLERIQKIEDRVKKLEQAQPYFPIEYPNQTGGVDNIKIGFTNPDMNEERR